MDRYEQIPESEKRDRYERLARKALAAYGLPDVRLTPIGTSTLDVFEVSTGDPSRHYALRICPPEVSTDRLQREILWLTALRRDTNLSVPEPILSLDGELIRKVAVAGVHGFRPCILFRWVEGETSGELTPEQLHAVGRLMGQLHAHAETFRWPEEITPPRRNATMMSEVLDEDLVAAHYGPVRLDVFRKAIESIATTMGRLRDGSGVAGVIHGRLNPRRLLFAEEGVGAVGFAACRWGYYAYDLATIRSHVAGREIGAALVAELLKGYRSVRELPPEVERAIPAFEALHSIDRIQKALRRPDRTSASDRNLKGEFEALHRGWTSADHLER